MDPSQVDDLFERRAIRHHVPGIAYGVVADGDLVHAGGVGTLRVGEDLPPGPDSVFRIASMTKCFTGAALMTLVAEGRVRLDEPAAVYVPALSSWKPATSDSPPITVRHLVTMASGLPTDDAWADRHLDIDRRALDDLLAGGVAYAHAPGVAFEYANLGWGIVGRVIEAASGVTAQELVTSRLLEPLGLDATTWVRPDRSDVASPHRWEDDAWVEESEPLGDGGIAPMGGLWSTVRDLAVWMTFFIDAFPPRDDPDDGPLPRWARREMQQLQRLDEVTTVRPRPEGPSRTIALGYGIGLGVEHDPVLGRVVGHSGGLPGYGSHFRWIPERRLGVIALANRTYPPMDEACAEALDVLTSGEARPSSPAAPALTDASARVAKLVSSWSDVDARDLFADNAELDESLERRRDEASRVVARHGPLAVESIEADTAMRGSFMSAGGLVKVDIELNHEAKVQWAGVTDRTDAWREPFVGGRDAWSDVAGTAYVIVRPTGDLADRFEELQGSLLDLVDGAPVTTLPPHATLKSFGSNAEPVTPDDEPAIAEVVAAWAAATRPLRLEAEALELFEGEERVPVVRLRATDELRAALSDLWQRCETAGLPTGDADVHTADGWIFHLSLAYPGDHFPDATWDRVAAWARSQDGAAGAAGTCFEAELLVFDGGPGRPLGRYPFLGGA